MPVLYQHFNLIQVFTQLCSIQLLYKTDRRIKIMIVKRKTSLLLTLAGEVPLLSKSQDLNAT